MAAAAAGKHVFCEKPLAIDIANARRMIEACSNANVVLQVGFNQRFWSQVVIAKQLIDAGFIGKGHAFRYVLFGTVERLSGGDALLAIADRERASRVPG